MSVVDSRPDNPLGTSIGPTSGSSICPKTYRDTLATLTETHMSSVANHMNEIMKMLTMINIIFVPLKFLTGV